MLSAQEALTLRFGIFGTDAYTKGVSEDHPNVQPVVREAEATKIIFGEGWHTDSPFLARPPALTILRSHETPEWGGDTFFANTELAYDHLTPTFQKMLEPLQVHMSAAAVLGTMEALDMKLGSLTMQLKDKKAMMP